MRTRQHYTVKQAIKTQAIRNFKAENNITNNENSSLLQSEKQLVPSLSSVSYTFIVLACCPIISTYVKL